MGLDKYFSKDDVLPAAEKIAELVVRDILFPALDKLVADNDNQFDDTALALVKPMILQALDKIDGEPG